MRFAVYKEMTVKIRRGLWLITAGCGSSLCSPRKVKTEGNSASEPETGTDQH